MVQYLLLIIEIDKSSNTYMYINRAHTVYCDSKDYSGLYIMIGRGAMINHSKKLRVVINSLKETEIVLTRERFLKYA